MLLFNHFVVHANHVNFPWLSDACEFSESDFEADSDSHQFQTTAGRPCASTDNHQQEDDDACDARPRCIVGRSITRGCADGQHVEQRIEQGVARCHPDHDQ